MSLIKTIKFLVNGDKRGELISLESRKNIPFCIKRVYYMYGTSEKISRGHHAHKKLDQVAICVSGSCRMELDDGFVKCDHFLKTPSEGILLEKMVWHKMSEFSANCVLMVLANDFYIESDYIRDYEEFLELKKNGN